MSTNELDDLYINRYADRVADPAEVLMRADYDRVRDLLNTAVHAETVEEMEAINNQAVAIANRWSDRDDHLGEAYRYLDDAYTDWARSPQAMQRLHEQIRIDQAAGVHVLSDIEWRSQQHARELTGHGHWHESLSEISPDSTRYNPEVPPPLFGRAAIAAREQSQGSADRMPIPGHAFAGLVNRTERGQELER